MHWTQIGKTLFEVWRDEHAPDLANTVCEAVNELQYYSGEFDIEWGNSVTESNARWHLDEQEKFRAWLEKNGFDYNDSKLSLGYLPIGKVDLLSSFGTENVSEIWDILSNHLDIYSIEVDPYKGVFDYCWSDPDHKEKQIAMMKPGYDYSSRNKE